MCLLQVRQHGGGEYTEESHSQGSSPDAPDAMCGVLSCNVWVSVCTKNNNQSLSLIPQIPLVTIPLLVLVLVIKRSKWGSQEWTSSFVSSLTRASHQPQEPSTCCQPGEDIPSSSSVGIIA